MPIADEVRVLIMKVEKLEEELRAKGAIKVPVRGIRRFPRMLRIKEKDLEDDNVQGPASLGIKVLYSTPIINPTNADDTSPTNAKTCA
jgi:hypothetical protein